MIKLVKLTNGDELIADVEVNDDWYNLDHPFVINSVHGDLSLVDYMSLSEETLLTMHSRYIISTSIPLPELIEYYSTVSEYTSKYSKPRMGSMISVSTENLRTTLEQLTENADAINEAYNEMNSNPKRVLQ